MTTPALRDWNKEVFVMRSTHGILKVVVGLGALLLIPATIALGTQLTEFRLTAVLLALFAEVLLVAILTDLFLSVAAAVTAVLATNWFLVPPFHTFVVADAADVIALVVFTAGAIATSWLVTRAERTQAAGARSRSEAEAYRALMRQDWPLSDPGVALTYLLAVVGLDEVEIQDPGGNRVAGAGRPGPARMTDASLMVIDEDLPDGFLLVGSGTPASPPDRRTMRALGTAAVRSYQSAMPTGH